MNDVWPEGSDALAQLTGSKCAATEAKVAEALGREGERGSRKEMAQAMLSALMFSFGPESAAGQAGPSGRGAGIESQPTHEFHSGNSHPDGREQPPASGQPRSRQAVAQGQQGNA